MDRAPSTVESLHALELRVLEGPQRGARAPLPAGRPCVLASGPAGEPSPGAVDAADIVLRDDDRPPVRLRLCAELIEASIEVLDGEVVIGGETLGAGAHHTWPQHVPLRLGGVVVAFGRACVDDWTLLPAGPRGPAGADGLADEAAAGAGDAPADGESPPAAAVPAPLPLRRRAEVWLAATGLGVLVACGGALAMARVATPPVAPVVDAAAALSGALRGSEFSALRVARAGDGRLLLKGRLATQSERGRLEAWLAAWVAGAPDSVTAAPSLEVVVDEALPPAVAEVFRVHGVVVQARVTGPGAVLAQAEEPDAGKLARARDAVRRDVPGLERLEIHNASKPVPPPPAPVLDDPGKRIASLVPGDPAFLVTADGARYFVGAVLPTGHRVLAIDRASVTLDRAGQRTTLDF